MFAAVLWEKRRTAALLSQKRKNASLPLREAGAVQHIGTIVGGKTERLCLFRSGLVYGSRQAFFDMLAADEIVLGKDHE